ANIAANGGYTLETYIKLDGTAGLQKVIDLEGYDALRVASGSTNVYFTPQGTQHNIGTGRWAHVAGVFDSDASQARFYVDGALIGTSAATLPRSMDNLNRGIGIGSHPTSFGEVVNGKLAETRVSLGALAPRNFRMSPTLVRLGFDSNDVLPTILDTSDRWNHATAAPGATLDPNIPLRGGIVGAGDRSLRPGGGATTTNNNNLLTNANIATFGGYTLETWIYLDGTSGSLQKIIDLEGYDSLRVNSNTTDVYFSPAGAGINFDIGLNRWCHVAGVLDLDAAANPAQALASLYVDGLLIGSAITTANRGMDALSRPISFGSHPLGGELFNGLLFESRVSLGALSPDQFLTGVPEPTTMTLLALGGLALLRRRRRRRHVAMLMAAALLVAVCHTASAAPITPPVAATAWLLDEGAGTALSEYKGTGTGLIGGHVGVLPPQWSTDTPFAYTGNASLSFVGTGVSVPSNWCELDGHTSATQGTVSFWIKDEDGGNPRYALDATDGSRTLMYRTAGLGTYINQYSIGDLSGSLIPGPGDGSPWTHVAITWDTTLATDKQKIYQNGVLFDTRNVAIGARSPAHVYLGSRLSKNEGWGGKIDEYALWNKTLSADEIEWLAQNPLSKIPTQSPHSPVAAWLFDEGSGTTARARFGGADGTLHSNVTYTTNTPLQRNANDRALYFDGTVDNRVTFPGRTSGTEGTLSLWAFREGGAQYLFDASPGDRSLLYGHYDLYLNNAHLGGIDGELIPDNEWTLLTITWDNAATDGRQKIYKNGALFTTFDQLLSAVSPATFWLGNRYTNNEPWRGAIDEFALWDYALPDTQVGWLYHNSVYPLPEPCTMGLLAVGALAL
ncbi:PEP-CTERM sorting domain-containing protein, partial [bacterium]|nr:PEP-CTERM sorting domain-containing protein [bacterium]